MEARFGIPYARTGQPGLASLATAERYALQGRLDDAGHRPELRQVFLLLQNLHALAVVATLAGFLHQRHAYLAVGEVLSGGVFTSQHEGQGGQALIAQPGFLQALVLQACEGLDTRMHRHLAALDGLPKIVETIDISTEGDACTTVGRDDRGEVYIELSVPKAGRVRHFDEEGYLYTLHDGELLDLPIPTEPHDRPVHAVATPSGVVRLR